MKRLITFAACILAFAISMNSQQEIQVDSPFQYLSPIPNSSIHLPGVYIVVRDGQTSYQLEDICSRNCSIYGSVSGDHEFEVKISRDGKTINLIPKVDFELGEEVSINLIQFPSNQGMVDFQWSFEITPKIIHHFEEESTNSNGRSFSDITFLTDAQEGIYDAPIFTQLQSSTLTSSWGILPSTAVGDAIFCSSPGPDCLGADVKVNRNGLPTCWSNNNDQFYMFDPNMNFFRYFDMVSGYTVDEHDFQIMPSGNYFLFAYDMQPYDMSLEVDGGNPNATVEGFVIQEFDFDDVLLLQWRTWDHLNVTDNEDQNLTSGIITPFHVNALEVDNDGNIFTSSRHTNEITKIDRYTGDVIWRWTINSYGDFDFVNDIGFSYQHDARRLENGNILLFDNANVTGQLSRVVEFELDTINWTATKVWQYAHPQNLFGSSRGGAQRLPNGNTMIAWGAVASDDYGFRISEVNSQNEIMMEFAFDLGFEGYRAPKHLYDPENWIAGCGDPGAPNYNPNADYWLPQYCQEDLDGDGFSVQMGDCNDDDDDINPDAEEIPYDGIDQDCDGEDLVDVDGDGFSPDDGDCNDDDEDINPDVEEIPYDDIDQDCDGEDLVDVDGDGFSPDDGDCNDDDEEINPDGVEIPNDGIDQDCDGEDLIVGVLELNLEQIQVWTDKDKVLLLWSEIPNSFLEIYDTAGRLVLETKLHSGLNEIGSLDSQGVYLVRIITNEGWASKRLFVN